MGILLKKYGVIFTEFESIDQGSKYKTIFTE